MVVKSPNDILLDLDRMIEELTRLRARVAAWTAEREGKGESLIRLDDEGYLVFSSEEAYAAYLDNQPDKYPSEIRAYFIDEHNFKVRYSDYEPTLEKIKELKEARQEIAEGDVVDGEEAFRKLGYRIPYSLDHKKRLVIIEDIDQHDAAYRRLKR